MKLKKQKMVSLVMSVVTISALFAGCGKSEEKGATDSKSASSTEASTSVGTLGVEVSGDAINFIVAGPTTDNGKEALEQFKTNLEKSSGGTMTCTLYQDNQLGDDAAEFQMAQNGDVDIAVGSTSNISSVVPNCYLFDIPYLFSNYDEVHKALDGDAIKDFNKSFENYKVINLGLWDSGFRELTTNNKDIQSVEDLKGLKIRTMTNDVHLAAWKAMGANPTPMNFSEVYTAMQQKTVDGQENPIAVILNNNFQEVEKYIVYTDHVYTPFFVVMNLDKYNKLTDEQKKWLTDAFELATKTEQEVTQRSEEEADKKFEEAGCTVTHLSDDVKKMFKEKADSANCVDMVKEKMENPEILDELLKELGN